VDGEAGLWRPRRRKTDEAHLWRERRSRFGELVQWDTSDHDWLEGRGGCVHLIHMIDDATSRVIARFVPSDSSEENMRLLWTWLERHGRPLAVYTNKDSMFHNAPKRVDGADLKQMEPTQIGRALAELGIAGIRAHSPQAKGRVERSFRTAQDRLVKGLRVERSADSGSRQRVSGARVSALVGSALHRKADAVRRCAPAPRQGTRFVSHSELRD